MENNKIIFYRTYSYGGMEGKTLEKKDFETEYLAKLNAMSNNWNSDYTLYEVTIEFNGVIKKSEKFLGKIPCGRDIKNSDERQLIVEQYKKAYETTLNDYVGWKGSAIKVQK